jgi:uncharacterized Tic20 family protein
MLPFKFLKSSPEIPQEEKAWARRSHLTTILTYPMALLPFPFTWEVLACVGFPLIIWLSRKKTSYSAKQALEAIYLQSILSFGFIGFGTAFSEDRVLLVFSYGFMVFFHALLLGIAVVKTSLGKNHSYPFSFFPFLFRMGSKSNLSIAKQTLSDKESFEEYKLYLSKLDAIQLQIASASQKWNDIDLKTQLLRYSELLALLKTKLEEKPNDYKLIRQYLNYFPETTSGILTQYNLLKTSQSGAEDVAKRKENFLDLIKQVNSTTEQVLDKIQSSQKFALDVEIEAMKQNIRLGGFT